MRALLARYSEPGQMVLDVGCGPARYRHATQGIYIGTDISDAPYSEAVPRAVDVVAAARTLPFGTATFDLVMSKSAFYLMPDHRGTLGEFARVLRPKGRLLLIDYNRRTQRRLDDKGTLPCWRHRQLRRLAEEAGFRDCRLLLPRPHQPGPVLSFVRLLLQDLFGTWAIVTGTKPPAVCDA